MIVKRTEASVLISWTQDTPTTVYEVIWGQQQQSVALEIGQEIVSLPSIYIYVYKYLIMHTVTEGEYSLNAFHTCTDK